LWSFVLVGYEAMERSQRDELGVMPYMEENQVIESLMFQGDLGDCVDTKVEDLRFEDSNPRMVM
jgi:hypothetical protein